MGYLYYNNTLKKKHKVMYFSPNVWRSIYSIHESSFKHNAEKKIFNRGSFIPSTYVGFKSIVHSGNKFNNVSINRWKLGHKFGEFTWNRRYALYKPTKKKK